MCPPAPAAALLPLRATAAVPAAAGLPAGVALSGACFVLLPEPASARVNMTAFAHLLSFFRDLQK
jgi:hypothetical protein